MADMTISQWVGLVTLIVFSAVLIWSLTRGGNPPPPNR
jgi:hypothetical protein